MKDFKDRVAVITGAASGIGYGLAERCAQEGMKVVLADVEEGALAQAEKDIKPLGAATLVVKTDVSRADDVKALAEKTMDTFGAVHLLFNNAGVSAGPLVWQCTLSDWKWVIGVNLWGVIHGVHFFLPVMLKQNTECHIVNTASAAGLVTSMYASPYAITKHGVVALSETLYRELELEKHDIGISVLCPGWINTRILDCARNRPAELQNVSTEESGEVSDQGIPSALKGVPRLIADGMSPQQVADIVFNAISQKKFYIFPNAEQFKPIIQTRMEDILQERNPTPLNIEDILK